MGSGWGRLNSEREFRRFLAEALGPDAAPKLQAQVDVVIGKPTGSPFLALEWGSVTYRVLCLAPVLTLALPPETTLDAPNA